MNTKIKVINKSKLDLDTLKYDYGIEYGDSISDTHALIAHVGRPTIFGNHYHIGRDGTRTDVLRKYLEWIVAPAQEVFRQHVCQKLAGKDLVCHCAPLPCHAYILAACANPDDAEYYLKFAFPDKLTSHIQTVAEAKRMKYPELEDAGDLNDIPPLLTFEDLDKPSSHTYSDAPYDEDFELAEYSLHNGDAIEEHYYKQLEKLALKQES